MNHESIENNSGYTPGKSTGAIIGLVLGIIALITSFLPIINNGSAILAFIGLICSVVGVVGTMRKKKSGKGLAIVALIINILAIAIVVGTQSMYSSALDKASKPTLSSTNGSAASATAKPADASADQSSEATSAQASSDAYTITDDQIVKDTYSAKIAGTLTNNTDKKISNVQVTYTVYDAQGAQIGTAYANTTNLEPNGTWKFEAFSIAKPDQIATYKLSGVTGF